MTKTPEHLKNACLILNTGAGTILSTGKDEVEAMAREILGDDINIIMSQPEDQIGNLDKAFAGTKCDVVIAGGGDGTVSAAGKLALKHGKTLGVVPLGTMNLFARALGMPQPLDQALNALLQAEPASIDVGEANGHPFFNHVSVGIHAAMIRIRNRMSYAGRISKIIGSFLALRRAAAGAPLRQLSVKTRDGTSRRFKSSLTVVTVNPVPDEIAQLPFRPGQNYGKLGCYMYSRQGVTDVAVLMAELSAGNWSQNKNMDFLETVELKLDSARRMHASVDGEIVMMHPPLRCRVMPGALKALVLPQGVAEPPASST